MVTCSQHFGNELFTKLMQYDAATAKLAEQDYASVPAIEVFKLKSSLNGQNVCFIVAEADEWSRSQRHVGQFS